MSPQEMLAHCRRQQDVQGRPDAFVTFVLPRPWPRTERVRLFPRGPLCRVLGGAGLEQTIVACEADQVIVALAERLAREAAPMA